MPIAIQTCQFNETALFKATVDISFMPTTTTVDDDNA
jgi:hypothetical protein